MSTASFLLISLVIITELIVLIEGGKRIPVAAV